MQQKEIKTRPCCVRPLGASIQTQTFPEPEEGKSFSDGLKSVQADVDENGF